MARNKLTPQAQMVLRHILKFGSITSVEAHNILKVRSVSRRITELDDVHAIVVTKENKRDVHGQRYVRYSLTNSERAWVRHEIGDQPYNRDLLEAAGCAARLH